MKEIEITTGMNGYPEHLHKGFIGFDTMSEAEKFAQENHGEVVELRQRDGWPFWESRGRAFEALTIDADTYGDDYRTVETVEDWKEDCHGLLSMMMEDGAELDDLAAAVAEMKEVEKKIESLKENEAVLLCRGEFCEVIKTRALSYHEDVWSHEIGVELR